MDASIEEEIAEKKIDPSKIMQIGMGFWASKTLLTAVNMELFTHLAKGKLSGLEIQNELGLNKRSVYDFLDTLVALGFLKRTGLKESAVYENSEETDMFLDKNKPNYIGGLLEMCNNRLYPFWNNLQDGLTTGKPQNEIKSSDSSFFEILYADESRLNEFINAMAGIQMGNFISFASQFNFDKYHKHCDIGGSGGHLSIQVVKHNPHIASKSFDLPKVARIARQNIVEMGLSNNVESVAGNFFKDDFPKVDVITMGNILHDWGMQDKKDLIKKAYEALPGGGALVVIENIIDDGRCENTFGLLMSLNMLIETEEGFDFSAADFAVWAKETGFKEVYVMPLTGPASAVIATK